jgi:hypothetical protein
MAEAATEPEAARNERREMLVFIANLSPIFDAMNACMYSSHTNVYDGLTCTRVFCPATWASSLDIIAVKCRKAAG